MNNNQWKAFCEFRNALKQKILEWNALVPDLRDLQKKAAELAGTPDYPFENSIVYNTDLDKLTAEDDIKLIVIGDNPGKDEQLTKNQRYLCGQAGKLGEGFFKKHPELETDFRRNVIILNKTPVHSAKTLQLKKIMELGGKSAADLILESQLWMAEQTAKLHQELNGTQLWLVGYSELKEKGIFSSYRDTLKTTCTPQAWERVYVFQHFSMNRFTIDLADFIKAGKKEKAPLEANIHELGILHRKELFGC